MLGRRDEQVLPSIDTFEGILAEVENGVAQTGHAMLFTEERLRLDIALTRMGESTGLKWGFKTHEEWVFKATLLRFARCSDRLHLVLEELIDDAPELRVWVVGRTLDRIWASPLSYEQVQQFWDRCTEVFAREFREQRNEGKMLDTRDRATLLPPRHLHFLSSRQVS